MVQVRFDHVRVNVSDLVRAERFYTDVLGMQRIVHYESPGRGILQLGHGGRPPGVELWSEEGQVLAPRETDHVAFAVDDVPVLVERARGLGYQVHAEPWMIGDETVASVKDPDGNLIELNDFVGR